MKKSLQLLFAASLLAAPAVVQAAPSQMFPVPSNAYITSGLLNWAWASPCNIGGCSSITLGDGWRYATAVEWAARPLVSDFLDPLGNFAGSGGQMKCASPWFDNTWDHCDYADANNGFLASGPGNVGSQGYNTNSETWVVKDLGQNVVPEPSTVALLAAGMLALGVVTRRRRTV